MTSDDSGDKSREGLSKLVEDLEYHRSVGVDARLERAIRIEREAESAGATDLQMRARLVQADMRLRTGQGRAAALLAIEVNRWANEHGPLFLQARSHMILSSIFESVGDSASCLDHALCAIELLDDDTSPRTRGNFLLRLADALSVAGSFDTARERYREAEQLFVSVGDIERQINVLNNMAYSEYETGDVHRAWAAAEEMRGLADRSGYALSPPLLDTLARAHIGLGEYDEAAARLEAAIEQLDAQGDVQAVTPAELMLTLVDVQRSQGRVEAARQTLDRCREICRQRNLLGVEVEVLRVQAELDAAAGQFEQAYEAHRVFHTEFLKLNSPAARRTRAHARRCSRRPKPGRRRSASGVRQGRTHLRVCRTDASWMRRYPAA
jgi:two-component system, cell cycle response regulator